MGCFPNRLTVMSSREQFLKEIEAFMARTGVSPAKFGRDVANDGKFISRLRNGADVRLDTADRARAYMRDYKSASGKPRPRFRGASAAA